MVAVSVNEAVTKVRKGTYSVMPALLTIPGQEGSGMFEKVGAVDSTPHCFLGNDP